jgi:hypothetical protein
MPCVSRDVIVDFAYARAVSPAARAAAASASNRCFTARRFWISAAFRSGGAPSKTNAGFTACSASRRVVR